MFVLLLASAYDHSIGLVPSFATRPWNSVVKCVIDLLLCGISIDSMSPTVIKQKYIEANELVRCSFEMQV
jgi:hypothetical protein